MSDLGVFSEAAQPLRVHHCTVVSERQAIGGLRQHRSLSSSALLCPVVFSCSALFCFSAWACSAAFTPQPPKLCTLCVHVLQLHSCIKVPNRLPRGALSVTRQRVLVLDHE